VVLQPTLYLPGILKIWELNISYHTSAIIIPISATGLTDERTGENSEQENSNDQIKTENVVLSIKIKLIKIMKKQLC